MATRCPGIRHATGESARELGVLLKNRGEIIFVDASTIDWIEAADYYACVHVGPDTHVIRRTMSQLQRDLNPQMFFRVHRSAIVNLDRVHSLKPSAHGEYDVLLTGGGRVRLSRRYRRALQQRLDASRK